MTSEHDAPQGGDSIREDYSNVEFVIVPYSADTVAILPNTKYFYRYDFGGSERWYITPQWVFSNLGHFGIKVTEAWYHASSNHTGGENGGPVGWTMVPPFLVVGLASDDVEILRHHFERLNSFNPDTRSKSLVRRLTHYVPKEAG